jgi:ABC-2 type transport system permease protein
VNGLFALTLRQMLGGKKILLLAVFLSMPILLLGVVLLAKGFSDDEKTEEVAFGVFLYVLYPQGLCILASLIYGASLLAGEIEDKTLVYLFTRAQPRWKILLGKYVATAVVLGCMTAGSMSVCFLLAGSPAGAQLWYALMLTVFAGCFAYTALFALLGLALPRRAITIGLIYAVVVEFVLSLVPALIHEVSASYYLRSLAYHVADVDVPPEVLAIMGGASATTATVGVLVIPVIALALSAALIHMKEWPLTEGV